MSILEDRARELGRMIGQSSEYQSVKRANDALGNSRESVALLKRLDELRQRAQQMIERGEEPTQGMEQELDGLLEQVQCDPLYQGMAVAQENFDKVMMRVNEWILDGIKKGAAGSIISLS